MRRAVELARRLRRAGNGGQEFEENRMWRARGEEGRAWRVGC